MSADRQDQFELPHGQGFLARLSQRMPRIRLRLPAPGGRGLRFAALFFVAAVLGYYLIGMALIHKIDDDPNFNADAKPAGLASVDMTAALIQREVRVNGWVPNDPWFLPGAFLDNMRNFQMGLAESLRRYVTVMREKIGRQRGSSRIDADLEVANNRMLSDSTQWIFDWPNRWLPLTPAESAFAEVRERLLRYNTELAAGRAVADPRVDNLMELLDRVASDLGDATGQIDGKIGLKPVQEAQKEGEANQVALLDPKTSQTDDLFYYNKGLLYGNYMILKAARQDFAKVIDGRDAASLYANMLVTMQEAATLQPLVVLNGAPDSDFMPNHLATQGFYILRARVQMRELVATLANQK